MLSFAINVIIVCAALIAVLAVVCVVIALIAAVRRNREYERRHAEFQERQIHVRQHIAATGARMDEAFERDMAESTRRILARNGGR